MRVTEREHLPGRLERSARLAGSEQLDERSPTERWSPTTDNRRDPLTLEVPNQQIGGSRQIRNLLGAIHWHAAVQPLRDGLTADAEEAPRLRLAETQHAQDALKVSGCSLWAEVRSR